MRVLVCGGRHYEDMGAVWSQLDALLWSNIDHMTVIQGGASGADALARSWCESNEVPFMTYRAHWHTHGKAAGPIRNQQMLDEGKPDLVLAFPGHNGTADMVRRAREAGVEVIEIA